MDTYEKKYNEALERARQIKDGKEEWRYSDLVEITPALIEIFPELRESEDERIRKGLQNFLWRIANGEMNDRGTMPSAKMCQEWIAWIEKQKEPEVLPGFDEMTPEEKMNSPLYLEGFDVGRKVGRIEAEQKPAEWSEEDERKIRKLVTLLKSSKEKCMAAFYKDINECIAWVCDLRPQPREEIYKATIHDLAIRFMNYLDENKPEGKMCLSNGECADIEKAFIEHDWDKIMRYANKYQPHWKPSEEQINSAIYAVGFLGHDSEYRKHLESLIFELQKLN